MVPPREQDEFSIKRVLHPTDLSRGSQVALGHALKIAMQSGATLDVLHVERQREQDSAQLHSVRDLLVRWRILPPGASRTQVATLGLRVRKATEIASDPLTGILKHLADHAADLIVLAAHQREGLDRWMHKQISNKVGYLSHTATLFVPYGVDGFVDLDNGKSMLTRVVLPTAKIPWPQRAIDTTCELVRVLKPPHATYWLFHAGTEGDAPSPDLQQDDRWSWHQLANDGDVVQEILTCAEERQADLIAMATNGPHGFLDALRGSTTERVVAHAKCPVLAVPMKS